MATAAPTAPALPLDPSTRLRAPHTRTQVLGLSLQASAVAIFVAIAAVIEPSELAFFGPILALLIVGAGLSWRFGTWSKVVGIVLALAQARMMWWLVFHLAYPSSFADFVPGVLVALGIPLTIGGGIAAIVRRRHPQAIATTSERRIRQVALSAVVLAVLVSGFLHATGVESVSATEASGASPVTLSDFEFAEASYEVAAGGSVVVHNADPFVHDFTVPALGISEVVLPGSQKLIAIDAEPGTYQVVCTPHSRADENGVYEGMTAELTVR